MKVAPDILLDLRTRLVRMSHERRESVKGRDNGKLKSRKERRRKVLAARLKIDPERGSFLPSIASTSINSPGYAQIEREREEAPDKNRRESEILTCKVRSRKGIGDTTLFIQ